MSFYIGDRQLEPEDDDLRCQYCGADHCNEFALAVHARKCQAPNSPNQTGEFDESAVNHLEL